MSSPTKYDHMLGRNSLILENFSLADGMFFPPSSLLHPRVQESIYTQDSQGVKQNKTLTSHSRVLAKSNSLVCILNMCLSHLTYGGSRKLFITLLADSPIFLKKEEFFSSLTWLDPTSSSTLRIT